MHVEEPYNDAAIPTGQAWHSEAPGADVYPGGHGVQVNTNPIANVPEGHNEQE